jgi:hypothetical protein
LRGCLQPTEIFVQETADDTGLASEGKWRSSWDTHLCSVDATVISEASTATQLIRVNIRTPDWVVSYFQKLDCKFL